MKYRVLHIDDENGYVIAYEGVYDTETDAISEARRIKDMTPFGAVNILIVQVIDWEARESKGDTV